MAIEPDIRSGVRKLLRLDVRSADVASQDAAEELEGLLAARVEHLVARGMSQEAAREEATRRLGSSIDQARRDLQSSAVRTDRRLNAFDHIDNMIIDMRQAIRGLRRSPTFSVAVVLTLSLGIGAATSVFSIVNGVLIRSLPYPQAERLYRVFETAPPSQGRELRSIAIPTLESWREYTHSFDEIALYGSETFAVTGNGSPEQLEATTASGALFSLLGATPYLGRVFSPGEELPGAPPVVVVAYGLWQRRFGGDSTIVGRNLQLDGQSFQIVGVMAKDFSFPSNSELWVPIGLDKEYGVRGARHMSGIARLKPNVSQAAATTDLLSAQQRLAEIYPLEYAERGVELIPLAERLTGSVRPLLNILAGAVVLVLLVTCTNIANLLVARASARHREVGIRAALGASRGRIARNLLLESLLLFVAAGVVGTALSALVIRAVRSYAGAVLPRADAIQLDWPVLFFALFITALTGVLFGLLPAIHGSAVQPGRSMLDGSRGSTAGKGGGQLRAVLIVFETAMAALLLVGAGLLIGSMRHLRQVDPGLSTQNVLTFRIAPNTSSRDETIVRFAQIRDRIAALPGVSGVAMASRLPLSGDDHSNSFYLPGDDRSLAPDRSAQDRAISAGYFRALGVRLLNGREFTSADHAGSVPVAMVNESFARKWFGGTEAVGKRFTPTGSGAIEREVVGVVADTRQFSLDAAAEPEFYLPFTQTNWSALQVAVRTQVDARRFLSAVQQAVWAVDRDLPLGNPSTLEDLTAESGARRRLVAVTLSAFAGLSYLLAAVGLYGVIAYAVTQRAAEIGIRLALGAPRLSVARSVITRGLVLAALGTVAGLLGAIPLSHWLQGLLFGVSATDPATYFAVGLAVPLIAAVACGIPATRAARIDPASAMRVAN